MTAYNCNIILISNIIDTINILMLHTPSVFAVFLPKLFRAAGRKGTTNAPFVAFPCLEGSLQTESGLVNPFQIFSNENVHHVIYFKFPPSSQ
jgi:hypothetical protein